MKKCDYCNKPLPDEVSFCPYCMRKLVAVANAPSAPVIKRKKTGAVIAFAVAAVLIVAAVFSVFVWQKPKAADYSAAVTPQTQAPQTEFEIVTTKHEGSLVDTAELSILNSQFFDADKLLGEETDEPSSSEYGDVVHYYNNLGCYVSPSSLLFDAYEIDFSESNLKYTYKGISPNCDYDEVVAIFGKPTDDSFALNGEIEYENSDNRVKISFGNNKKVSLIFVCVSDF